MCGIWGVIGKAKQPKATFHLLTRLMVKTEPRGDQATGFWGTQQATAEEPDRAILYHKLPIKPTEMAMTDKWDLVEEFNPNLLIGHCRAPTGTGTHGQHQGPPKHNKNNHPHVSDNHRVALIHNGVLEEYHSLKDPYKEAIRSNCDSELLLHMFAVGDAYRDNSEFLKKRLPDFDTATAYRLLGITEIFHKVNYGAMAVAVGEHLDNGKRALWLFRDTGRPLTLIDLREQLGQVFFCSTKEIWREAVDACPADVRAMIPDDHEVLDFRPFYCYRLEVDDQGAVTKRMFKVSRQRVLADGEEEELSPKLAEQAAYSAVRVITTLDKDDEPIKEEGPADSGDVDVRPPQLPPASVTTIEADWEKKKKKKKKKKKDREDHQENVGAGEEPTYDMSRVETLVKQIKEAVDDIEVQAFNLTHECSLSESDFDGIVEDLTTILNDCTSAQFAVSKGAGGAF